MNMGIITMDMGITTINDHKPRTQSYPRNLLSGHKKAMLVYNGQHGFFFSYWRIYLFLLLFPRRLPASTPLRIANIFQVIPFAIETEDIRLA